MRSGRYLKAGVQIDNRKAPTPEGVPQGGPLSPVLANVVLDELDWELERRNLKFARYADDGQIYVGSRRAGERVMVSLTRFDAAEVLSPLRDLDKWIRRRMRSYVWKQWGRRGIVS